MIRHRVHRCLGLLLFGCVVSSFAQSRPDTQGQIDAHLREAHRLLSENKPAAAIPEFRAILALDPANTDALGNLGVLLFFQGQYADALPDLRGALARRQDLWKIQALLGIAELRTGNNAAARGDLETAFPRLEDKAVRVQTGLELVDLDSSMEALDKASAVISVLRGIDPENQEVLYAAYRVHSDLAREAVLSLALVAPGSARMYQVMAHEAARRGDTPAAMRDDREALRRDPRLPGLHFELAELLNTLPPTPDNQAQAASEYRTALADNPFDEKALLRLGAIAEHSGDPATAGQLYARAVALQPDDPEACYDLGRLLLATNQVEKAAKLLEHAAQADPTDAVIHFRLATAYQRLGRTADAEHEIEQYRKYKDLKDKLRETFRELHLDPQKMAVEESEAGHQP
ncbi:MAG TPA: tetratricopeptide repeat protein [Acidobacteriaceae bacterium]|jgi:Flp pilus assembly protein TadD|nr:tetratricopeptide repeat protein [Acidobacteriaceae bacterium]